MRLWHRCFPVNFATFLRTPFFTEHVGATASALTYEMFQNILNKTKYCTRIERENVILQKHSKHSKYGLQLHQKKLIQLLDFFLALSSSKRSYSSYWIFFLSEMPLKSNMHLPLVQAPQFSG